MSIPLPIQSGSGESSSKLITQLAHGFAVGNWVYLNGSNYTLTDADVLASTDSVGVVTEVENANTFTLTSDGYATGLTGLVAGTRYYLSTTAGAITATAPTNSKSVLIADSISSGYVQQYGSSGITTQNLIYGRVNASSDLASTVFTSANNGVKIPFSNIKYTSGITAVGTDVMTPSVTGRYRVSWLMQADSGAFDGNGYFVVMQNGVFVDRVLYNMTLTGVKTQASGFIDVDLVSGLPVELRYQPITATDTIVWQVGSYFQLSQLPTAVAPVIGVLPFTGSNGIVAGTNGIVPAPAITDNTKFLKGDGTWSNVSGGGASNTQTFTQTAHGFTVGDELYISSANTFAKTDSDSPISSEWIGTVSAVTDANNFTLRYEGIYVTDKTGLVAPNVYYISGTAGGLTITEPSAIGSVSKPVFQALNSTSGFYHNFRGSSVGIVGTTSTVSRTITQTAHGLVVGNWIWNSAPGIYALTSTASDNQINSVGVVSQVIDANNFVIVTSGYVNLGIFHLLSATNVGYLSATSGQLTAIKPIERARVVFIADSTTSGYVQQYTLQGNGSQVTVNKSSVDLPGPYQIAMGRFASDFEFFQDQYYRFDHSAGHFRIAAVGTNRSTGVYGFNESSAGSGTFPIVTDPGFVGKASFQSVNVGVFSQVSDTAISTDYDDIQMFWIMHNVVNVKYRVTIMGGSGFGWIVERWDYSTLTNNTKITFFN